MLKRALLVTGMVFLAICNAKAADSETFAFRAPEVVRDSDLAGAWSGAIMLPGVELKVQILLSAAGDSWLGTIDIPQQSVRGLKLEAIVVAGQSVSFKIAGIPGAPTFSGKHDGAAKIEGDFTQGGQTFPFELTRGELPKAKRPQNPVPPFPYSEESVTVTNGDIKLAGTLTTPAGKGPFPVVILVSGSGPQNRDEELFEHRPFAVWADHLGRNGIAVLRYDDRGVGESTGHHASATSTDLATDAEAWVGFLKNRPGTGPIGIMGHSEGGIIAPMVAARNPDVAFIVMLAGTAVSGAEVLIEQNRALARASGATAEVSDRIAAAARGVFEALASNADAATVRAKTLELVKAQTGKAEVDAAMEQSVAQAVAGLKQPWFREFIRHDPAPDLRKVRVPVLALFGERDVQVVPAQNLPPLAEALQAAGNEHVTLKVIPQANHLFQKCTTGGVDEYAQIETTVEPEVLRLVGEWIQANAGRGK